MTQFIRITRHLEKNLLTSQRFGFLSCARSIQLKPQEYSVTSLSENHDERNMKLRRPLSPHLTVYAPEITSMLSITHRFTGMALAGYAVILGAGSLALPDTVSHYIDALASQHVGTVALTSGKFVLAFPLAYHFWNGIRHLIWDTGKFLTVREVYTTGYLMLALTVVSSIALCLF